MVDYGGINQKNIQLSKLGSNTEIMYYKADNLEIGGNFS